MSKWWDRVARGECGRCGTPNDNKDWINLCDWCIKEQSAKDRAGIRRMLQFLFILMVLVAVHLVVVASLLIAGEIP